MSETEEKQGSKPMKVYWPSEEPNMRPVLLKILDRLINEAPKNMVLPAAK